MTQANILSVYDEGALENTPLIGAKGLSILVDVDGQRTLFDTGLRGRYLIHNLEELSIKPESIDRVVLSHGHKDHTGGLNALLEARETPLEVYATPETWFQHRKPWHGIPIINDSAPKIPENLLGKIIHKEISGKTTLSENLSITTPIITNISGEKTKKNESWEVAVSNEVVLVLSTKKGPVAICGCCHSGIGSVMQAVKDHAGKEPCTLIGGTHLTKVKKAAVASMIEELKAEFPQPEMYLNHCTGADGIMHVRETLGLSSANDFYVGSEIKFEV